MTRSSVVSYALFWLLCVSSTKQVNRGRRCVVWTHAPKRDKAPEEFGQGLLSHPARAAPNATTSTDGDSFFNQLHDRPQYYIRARAHRLLKARWRISCADSMLIAVVFVDELWTVSTLIKDLHAEWLLSGNPLQLRVIANSLHLYHQFLEECHVVLGISGHSRNSIFCIASEMVRAGFFVIIT